jgi:hypothetical protein
MSSLLLYMYTRFLTCIKIIIQANFLGKFKSRDQQLTSDSNKLECSLPEKIRQKYYFELKLMPDWVGHHLGWNDNRHNDIQDNNTEDNDI